MNSLNGLKAEQEKLTKGTSAFGGILIVMVVVCVYGTVQNGVDFMTFLPIFFIPILLVNIFKIGKLRKEIKSKE
ncbi:hypothetical protein ACFQZJ_11035 [Maribacter chungangensis]|uniref:Redox-active disulfide protein 2 n=1 Tax=Maribacter chungangensis TaxID=1069117 RepID=A0ABW3B607_9FLAO